MASLPKEQLSKEQQAPATLGSGVSLAFGPVGEN